MTPAVRPTRGVAVAVAVAVVLHLLGRITGGGWLALASAAALVLPLAALLLRPRLDGLEVTSTPVSARVGDEVEVHLVVRNAGRRPSPPVRLADLTPGLSPLTVAVPGLAPGREVAADLRRAAVARTVSDSSPVQLTSTAPFGLVRVTATRSVAARVVVAPRPVTVPALPDGGQGAGSSSRPLPGVGTEVLGLRPWRPGDGARAVHARSSARHGRPVVLERERDTGSAVVVLCTGAGAGPEWEAAVASACSVAEQAVRHQRAPVLLATGHPAPRVPDLAAVLAWHAGLDAAQPLDAATVAAAARAAGSGGTVVLVSGGGLLVDRAAAVRRACAAVGAVVVEAGRP